MLVLLLYLGFIGALFYRQVKKVKAGQQSKPKALAVFLAYTTAPALLYLAVFFLLLGIEEFTDLAVIGEGYARSLLMVVSAGVAFPLLLTLILFFVFLGLQGQDR